MTTGDAKRWLKPALKLAIVAVLIYFVRQTLFDALRQIGSQDQSLDVRWLVASGVLYSLGQLPAGIFWQRLLRDLGQVAPLGRTLRAYYIGNPGKYVPGKALVIVLRAGFVGGPGTSRAVAAVCVFVETLTVMAVGGFLAGAILATQFAGDWRWLALSLGLMIATGLPTAPPIFRRLIRLVRVGKANPAAVEQLDRLKLSTLATGWLLCGVGWLLMGLSLWATLRGMGLDQIVLPDHLPLLVASVSLAVVAGFLSFIPGGAVVREAVLLNLLTNLPGVSKPTALLSAIVLRLVTVVAEVAVAGVLYLAGGRRQRPSARASG